MLEDAPNTALQGCDADEALLEPKQDVTTQPGPQEPNLKQTQLGLYEANLKIECLTSDLKESVRAQEDHTQYFKLTKQSEYGEQVREMKGRLQAQQAHTAALQQALEVATAQHAQDLLRIQQERKKTEEAKGFLHDAHAQMDGLEQELSQLLTKMKHVAAGLDLANNQEQQVAQGLRRLVSELSEQLAFLQNANAVLQRRDAHREVQCERDLPQAEAALPEAALVPMGSPADAALGAVLPVTPLAEGHPISPPGSPCALQLNVGHVPFWGLPASPPPAVCKVDGHHVALPAAAPVVEAPGAATAEAAPVSPTAESLSASSPTSPRPLLLHMRRVALPAAAPLAFGCTPTGPGRSASIRRRLDVSLGSAAGLCASAGRSSTLLGRTAPSSSSAGGVRKFLFADKENSPSAIGKTSTLASSGAPQQTQNSRAPFSLGNPAGRRPLAPMTEAEVASLPWGPRVLQRSMRHLPISGLPAPAAPGTGSDAGSVLPKGTPPPAAGGRPTAVDPQVQHVAAEVTVVMAAQQVPLLAGPGQDVMSSGTMPARTAVVADATPPAAQQTIGADAQTEALPEIAPALTATLTGTAAGDASPSMTEASPATTPHALQLHVGHVPFWGLPAAASPAAASIDDGALPRGTPTTAGALPPTAC
ncbi:hypothetical protein ABBQ38_007441 [Trebouxia sp. C0009 RCD-2024]